MKTNKILILLFPALVFTTSCKTETPEPEAETKLGLLTNNSQKNWIISDVNQNGKSVLKDFFDSCELDDVITFKSNGEGSVDVGKVKCSYDVTQTYSFNWSLFDNDTKLRIATDNYSIKQLNKSTLLLTPQDNESINIIFSAR